MVNPISQEMSQLEEQIGLLYLTTANPSIAAATRLEGLNAINGLRTAYDDLNTRTLQQLASATEDVGNGLLSCLRNINEQLEELEILHSSLQDKVTEELLTRPEEKPTFQKIQDLFAEKQRIYERNCPSGEQPSAENLKNVVDEIESTLVGRATDLAADATEGDALDVRSFFQEKERLEVGYFHVKREELQNLTAGNFHASFQALLPLLVEVNDFIAQHEFISDESQSAIESLAQEISGELDMLIQMQEDLEARSHSGAPTKASFLQALEHGNKETLKALYLQLTGPKREELFRTLSNIVCAETSSPIPPGRIRLLRDGSAALTDFASEQACRHAIQSVLPDDVEQQEGKAESMREELEAIKLSMQSGPSEIPATLDSIVNVDALAEALRISSLIASNDQPADLDDSMELAQALEMSEELSSGKEPAADETASVTQAASLLAEMGRGLTNSKIELAKTLSALLQGLQGANLTDDVEQLHGQAHLIEDANQQTMWTIYGLQYHLHRQLGKFQEFNDYGRIAFFGDFPPTMQQCSATEAERSEVINRVLVRTLLNGIKEAIQNDDVDNLRTLLDQLGEIRLNRELPGYYNGNENLEYAIRGFLFQAHVQAGFPASSRNHGDFGRVALRNEEGRSATAELKLAAVARLEEQLRVIWEN